MLHIIDHLLVGVPGDFVDIFAQRLAGDGHAVTDDQAVVHHRLHQHVDTARRVHVPGDIFAARLQVGEIGRGLENLRDVEQVEFDPRLAGHGRQMQRGIGRAAGGGNHAGSVDEGVAGADIARAQIELDQVHDLATCGPRHVVAGFIGGWRHIAVRQRQADRLGDAGHGVGGKLAAARAVTGTGDLFQLDQFLQRAIAGAVLAHRLEHVDHGHVMVVEPAGQDRTAIDEDRRHVEPQHCHHHAGKALVAAGIADDRVVAVAADAEFDAVCDDLAGDQRGLHALVAHGDAVGDGDRVEPARRAAGLDHALAGDIGLPVEQGVARSAVVAGGGDADEGFVDILFRHPHRIIIAALGRALRSDTDVAAGQAGLVESFGHSGFQYRNFQCVPSKTEPVKQEPFLFYRTYAIKYRQNGAARPDPRSGPAAIRHRNRSGRRFRSGGPSSRSAPCPNRAAGHRH